MRTSFNSWRFLWLVLSLLLVLGVSSCNRGGLKDVGHPGPGPREYFPPEGLGLIESGGLQVNYVPYVEGIEIPEEMYEGQPFQVIMRISAEFKKPVGVVLAIAASAILLAAATSWTGANDSDLPASTKQSLAGERATAAGPGWPPVEPFVFDVEVAPLKGGWRVSWEAQLVGDYNQDGIVNILDITPLAAHFNETVADNPSLIVVDGNGDWVVNIMDITPLVAHFGLELIGLEIQVFQDEYEWQSTTVATVGFKEHKLPVEGRLAYETNIATDATSGYLRVASIIYPEEPGWLWDPPVPLPGTE